MAYLNETGLAYFKGKLDETMGASIEALEEDIGQTYSRNDGNYENLTAGTAESVLSEAGITDKVPYAFRASGGNGTNREIDKIVGGTVCWNQLLSSNTAFQKTGGTVSTTDGVGTFTANEAGQQVYKATQQVALHVYFTRIFYKTTTATTDVVGRIAAVDMPGTASTNWQAACRLYRSTTSGGASIGVKDNRTSGYDAIYVKNAVFIDLTKMFGSTIADRFYALEQATAGAGVALFRSLFPNDYYADNEGELMSVQVAAHETVGFNLWDGAFSAIDHFLSNNGVEASSASHKENISSYIPVIGGNYYHIEPTVGTTSALCWYDAEKNYIAGVAYASGTKVTELAPNNAKYLRVTVYKANIDKFCVNLSSDRDGEYEPYQKHTYQLDSSLTLRGIPKLDENNNLYYDGDTYEADGTVTRRYGIVDLGTLTWGREPDGAERYYTSSLSGLAKGADVLEIANAICNKYVVASTTSTYTHESDNILAVAANYVRIYTSTEYASTDAFKAAMSGVYLVYELATPTTETAEPYHNPQIVNEYGTEEYIDAGVTATTPTRDVAIPVGHETFYPENVAKKVGGLPWDFNTLIANTESGFTATKAYSANDFLIVNNQLYIVTASIANGGTITPGTNVTATTLGAQITALLNS